MAKGLVSPPKGSEAHDQPTRVILNGQILPVNEWVEQASEQELMYRCVVYAHAGGGHMSSVFWRLSSTTYFRGHLSDEDRADCSPISRREG
jgi:hypothetical protein